MSMEDRFVLRWWWSDHSGSGTYNRLFTQAQVETFNEVFEFLSPSAEYEWVQVYEPVEM
jgi:hypothetical protein